MGMKIFGQIILYDYEVHGGAEKVFQFHWNSGLILDQKRNFVRCTCDHFLAVPNLDSVLCS